MNRKSLIPILFGLLFFIGFSALAQEVGKPFLKNYPPKEYGGQSQNWYITQDQRGVIFIGNGDGVLEYDGTDWHTTETRGKLTVRSIEISEGNIPFVGLTKGFGYLEIGEMGESVYHPLDTLLPDSVQSELSDVWATYTVKNAAYFRTNNYLFRYKEGEVDYWGVNEGQIRFYSAFILKDKFYVSSFGPNGSREVRTDVGDELQVIPNNDGFQRRATSIWVPYKEDTVILGGSGNNYYKYPFSDNHEADSLEFRKKFDAIFERFGRASTDAVKFDGGYAIATFRKGILIFDEQYRFKGVVNQEKNGLITDQVYHLYADRDGAVWAGMANGIARVDLSSEVTFWDKNSGLKGSVYYVTRFKGDLYINTSIFLYRMKDNGEIERVPNTPSTQYWHAIEFQNPDNPDDKRLLVSTRQIYEVTAEGGKQVSEGIEGYTLFKMYQDPENPYRVWLGTRKGLASILWKDGEWVEEPVIPGMSENSRSIIRDKAGNIWVGTYRNGVFKFAPAEGGEREFEITHYTTEEGLPSMRNPLFYKIDREAVVATGKGMAQYNPETDRFEPYTKLGDQQLTDGSRDVYVVDQDYEGNVWITGEVIAKSPPAVYRKKNDGRYYSVDTKPFKKVPPMVAETILAEKDGTAWIGGSEGLYRYSPTERGNKAEEEYPTLVRKVIAGDDSVLFAGSFSKELASGVTVAGMEQKQENVPVISSNLNSIDLYFAAPFFDNESQTQYKYYLEGFEDDWSDWGNKREKEYTNLSGGDYTFHVKARNLYGNESEVSTFTFKVLPPFYLTWWAFVLYAVIALLIIRGVVKYNAKRLERENERLEGIIEERTAEIKLQAENLRSLNEEMSAVNDSLSTKTEALEKANANMSNLSSIGKAITSTLDIRKVVRIIYENVNHLMDASGFGVGVYHKEENILEFKGYMERGKALEDHYETVTNDHSTVALRVFNTAETYFSNDVEGDLSKEGTQMKVAQGATPKSLIYMPLVYGEQTVGVITVQSFETNAYSDNELNILQTLASYASIALANAKGYEVIQEKNKSITDSIRYSKTMQDAFLPTPREMMALGDHFILYKPREIVSGDFYWVMHLPETNKLFVASVDCTGHGVPGALMSIVGVTLLNEIVGLQQVHEPAQILEELNKGVMDTLNQHDPDAEGNDDGMDVCLCLLEKQEDGGTNVTFSGAKSGLLFVRNGQEEVESLKGDNKLIGGYQKRGKEFTNQTVTLHSNDCLYLTTDGFVDQHDAERHKYGSLRFKTLLAEIASLPMGEQYKKLEDAFEDHQGQVEQRDDVTVLGINL